MEVNVLNFFKDFEKKSSKKAKKKAKRVNHSSFVKIFDYINLSVIKHFNKGYLSNCHFRDNNLIKEFGISKSSYDEKIGYLKQLGILVEVTKPSYKSKSSTEFYVKKTEFIIYYFLETLFSSFEKSFKKKLTYRKIKLDYRELFKVLFEAITSMKPIPAHASKLTNNNASKLETEIVNGIYAFFFDSLKDFLIANLDKYSKVNPSYQTPILRYILGIIGNEKQLTNSGSQKVQHQDNVAPSSPSLVGAGLWSKNLNKLSKVWLTNQENSEQENIFFDGEKYKLSFNYLNTFNLEQSKTQLVRSDLFEFRPFVIRKSISRSNDKEIKEVIAKEVCADAFKESKLIKKINEINNQLRNYNDDLPLKLSVSVNELINEEDVFGDDLSFEVKLSMRNWSRFNKEEKKMRESVLKDNWGAVDSYDFKTCSFNLVRLLNNKGKFDVDWGLKELIIEEKFRTCDKENALLTRGDLRNLTYILFNKKTSNVFDISGVIKAINIDIKNKIKNPFYIRQYPKLQEDDLKKMVGIIYRECGNWTKYVNNIYFLESLLEMMIRLEMNRLGLYFENIYDCLFFNPNQISRKDFLTLIKKIVGKFHEVVLELKPEISLGRVNSEPDLEKKYLIYLLLALGWSKSRSDFNSFTFKNKNLENLIKKDLGLEINEKTKKEIYKYLSFKGVARSGYDQSKGYSTFHINWHSLAELLIDALNRKVIIIDDILGHINRIMSTHGENLEWLDKKPLEYFIKFSDLPYLNYDKESLFDYVMNNKNIGESEV